MNFVTNEQDVQRRLRMGDQVPPGAAAITTPQWQSGKDAALGS
jgi:hypothetical protein